MANITRQVNKSREVAHGTSGSEPRVGELRRRVRTYSVSREQRGPETGYYSAERDGGSGAFKQNGAGLGFVMFLIKAFLVLLLLGFIWLIFAGDSGKSVDMEKAREAVSALIKEDSSAADLVLLERSDLSKNFGLDSADYEDFLYLAAEDLMDVSELLVIKTSDETKQAEIMEAAASYLEDLKSAWKNYGTNQYDLIEDAVARQKGDCFIFVISENADAWEAEILSCVN